MRPPSALKNSKHKQQQKVPQKFGFGYDPPAPLDFFQKETDFFVQCLFLARLGVSTQSLLLWVAEHGEWAAAQCAAVAYA